MADQDKTTLVVALAGIAATAVVGLAGTVLTWVSAGEDRREQSALARQSLNYERRVAVYLDAIDFVETQERALWEYGLIAENRFRKPPESLPRHFPLPQFFLGDSIPFEEVPPRRLITRLRALGSSTAMTAFRRAEALIAEIPITLTLDAKGRPVLRTNPDADRALGRDLQQFDSTYRAFYDQVTQLQKAVHAELGTG